MYEKYYIYVIALSAIVLMHLLINSLSLSLLALTWLSHYLLNTLGHIYLVLNQK